MALSAYNLTLDHGENSSLLHLRLNDGVHNLNTICHVLIVLL